MFARFLLRSLSLALLATCTYTVGEDKSGSMEETPSFKSYRETTLDRTWVTPIGVAGHHRTFGVSFSGNICDMPLCQFDTFGHKARPWGGGTKGVFYESVGLAIGRPDHFWGTGTVPLHHRLVEGDLPVVISEGRDGDLGIEQTAFASLPQGEIESRTGKEPLLAHVRVAVTNQSTVEQNAVMWVWRTGPYTHFGEIGGLTRRFEATGLRDNRVVGDSGRTHLIFSPGSWTLSEDKSGDFTDLKHFGKLSTSLKAGETKSFSFVYPYWPLDDSAVQKLPEQDFETVLEEAKKGWKRLLEAGMSVSVPDDKIGHAFATGIINTLLLTRRVPSGLLIFDSLSFHVNDPVSYIDGTVRLSSNYNLMYDDTAQKAIVHTLLETGHADYARAALEAIFHSQGVAQPGGAATQEGNLSAGNTTAVGERDCASVWMSGTGYSLWAAANYYRYTRDANWVREHQKAIGSALQWIVNERNRLDCDRGYCGVMRGRAICDSGLSDYHPYNDLVSYWGMKEIAKVLSELKMNNIDWEREAFQYGERIKQVYEQNQMRAYQGLGDTDYGLTGGAAVMSGLYPLDSKVGRDLAAGVHSGWYGMYHGRFFIELGQREQFLQTYYQLVSNHMSHDTHTNGEWPNPRDDEDKINSVINVQPHAHSNAGFHFMTRSMLVYEDANSVYLLRGIPGWWLEQGKSPISIRNAPLTSGVFNLEATRKGNLIEIETSLPHGSNKSTLLYLPMSANRRIVDIRVNGNSWTRMQGEAIDLGKTQGNVQVQVIVQ